MKWLGLKAQLAAASAIALVLGACDDSRRQVDAPQPAPLAELAVMSELPYAEPAPVEYYEPARGYQWAERAYGLQRTFYDAPPDYGLYYDGVEPWAWETADRWSLYAEPWDGDYRYYYYEPGAAYPYFVRDRDYGYAYGVGGILIAVFDSGGRYLPVDVAYRVAPVAGRYYVRGHKLRGAGIQRIRVDERVWAVEAPRVTRSADPWLRAARDDSGWRAWRERDQDRELQRFTKETRRREAAAKQWRERTARQEAAKEQRQEAQWDADAEQGRRELARDARRDRPIEADRPRAERQTQRNDVQVEPARQARVERQQVQADQHRQVQRQQAQAEQKGQVQLQQAQAEQRRLAQAERQKALAEQRKQARAASAEQSGKPAAANERGKGQGKKD